MAAILSRPQCVKLLGHVQNSVVIILLDFRWLQNKKVHQIKTVINRYVIDHIRLAYSYLP